MIDFTFVVICKLEEIKVSPYYYFAIECDKNKFNVDDMKQFPVLTLTLVCFNSEFNFDYKDLFTETKYKIFFNIIFNKFISERWVFGKPVLRKYPMLINYEAQTIGYYNENWEVDYGKKDKNKERPQKIKIFPGALFAEIVCEAVVQIFDPGLNYILKFTGPFL